jgi:hypothetical protein
MIIYTPVPPEVLWYQQNEEIQLVEGIVQGIPVQLKIADGKNAVVERILSTDPAHFLNNSCQPGSEISSNHDLS